ncbi:uncharacterized protein LOC124261168 [Haliotis rubra]|uniref:uncharacterized protein LOC124261168 n=1 Tax=Haliotis rubra TaxID=36100 RepID=UPI001EE61A91|nr:uncharacterized protein LOC124261168 [Haliotis rubra]
MLRPVLVLGLVSCVAADPCVDKSDNCESYGGAVCDGLYLAWAAQNCRRTCNLCGVSATVSPPCDDVDYDCVDYDKSSCSDPSYADWAKYKCRYFCRLCTAEELAVKDLESIPPVLCTDKVNCHNYGAHVCDEEYQAWSRLNCMEYCGHCKGVPHPPPACKDTVTNCMDFGSSLCSNDTYSVWVDDHCRKTCARCDDDDVRLQTP